MKKFEYKKVWRSSKRLSSIELNEFGDEGWELVSTILQERGMILFTFLKGKNMRRISDELSPGQKTLILSQLKCIKDTVSVCISRSIDDYDDVIGLLARLVSDALGYGVEEIKCSIDEQFE